MGDRSVRLLDRPGGEGMVALVRAEEARRQLARGVCAPAVVAISGERLGEPEFDAILCGGTLGVLLGAALARRGLRVAIVERGILRGRDQEWNISRADLDTFLTLDLLAPAELERAVATRIARARIAFPGLSDLWVTGVLDAGIDPVYLIEALAGRLRAAGGKVIERAAFAGASVHPDGVRVHTGSGILTGRLLIDAMGHGSPISRQIRGGTPPDGLCLVVGGCAAGLSASDEADLIVSFTPLCGSAQYFWEAFPARDGRTTYLFTYVDAQTASPGLTELFEDYLRLLPEYQGRDPEALTWKRALWGVFPSWRSGGLGSAFDRIVAVGDSSGNQSPLSFGGFGSMVRHLARLTTGIEEALRSDLLDRAALDRLQPYQPNLAVTWLFQRTMRVGPDQRADPQQVNRLLAAVFARMAELGDDVLKPFLQDVVQWGALTRTLAAVAAADPALVARVAATVGPSALAEWTGHYLALAAYSALDRLADPLGALAPVLDGRSRYFLHRRLDAWFYGSGGDLRHRSSEAADH